MPKQVYVFKAELVGVTAVRRTIAIRSDQTLDDLHHGLRASFAWTISISIQHLYSFWLKGGFWARNGSEYTHPFHAAQPNPLGPFARGPAPKSAEVRVDRLKLRRRTTHRICPRLRRRVASDAHAARNHPDGGGCYPKLLEQVGDAPPQYPRPRQDEDAA